MSTPEFDIIFRGDIVFGHQLADVKLKLQQLFKVDATKVDALFTGRPVPLKRNLDEATANKYRDVLLKVGAMVEVSPSDKAVSNSVARPGPTKQPIITEWTLAPVGTYLISPLTRPKPVPLAIDVSKISLRPASGNLLDSNEIKTVDTPAAIAPDFDVAEVGANLVEPDEKLPLPLVEFDIADWEIAEAGSDLLKPEEHPQVIPVEVDVSQFNLAPVGSDLGQLKPAVKAVVPDVSGISLADNNP